MAIEVNKRKRKHKIAENEEDDAEVAVPVKVAKKLKTPKKQKESQQQQQNNEDANKEQQHQTNAQEDEVHEKMKKTKKKKLKAAATNEQEENDECKDNECAAVAEDTNHDSGFEEKEMKFSKDFKMLHFRTKLRGTNFITELRHFLYMTEMRPKMIAKYIEKRGKPLELAEALERIDKTNVLHVAYICEALQLIVMEIISNQKSHLESAVHACRYFLKSHGTVIELLLKSAQLKHRRIALKLLTAIVCVEPQLGRQLLSSYDILSNVKTIENFLSHSKFELHEEDTVRKCFIHFVLAYLVDGNTLLIRNILDRGTLISALASGLIYDDHITVCVVLSTLRKYVLECTEISKTKKIHVFDLECCKYFARLYDWHGPKVFAVKVRGKDAAAAANSHAFMRPREADEIVDMQERDTVAAAVHEFLITLLTSRKFGITFDAVAHFRQKHNAIQGKIIAVLYKPWLNERKTELVLKILNACPDLCRNTVRNFNGIINPTRTAPNALPAAMNFLAKIINAVHPKLLSQAIDKMTLTDFSYWLKDVCLPTEALFFLNGSKMLRHENYDFRLAANRLLLAMFTQYANYMAAITKREQIKNANDTNSLRRFKFDILNHILVNFPPIEHILMSLYTTINMGGVEDAAVLAHLDVTLDLVLIVCKENRSFVNKTSTILNYLELLRPLYAADADEGVGMGAERQAGNIMLELKAIKTILLLFPQALKPSEARFSTVLKSFIKAFVHGTAEVQREAGALLRDIFKNTGIFDANEWEIDLWLEALRFIDNSAVAVVSEVFNEVLKVTKAEVEVPKTSESHVNAKNLHKLFANIEQGLSVQAYVETLSISKLLPLIFKGIEIIEPLEKYLEIVCLLMFHCYPMPECVLRLYELEFKSLQKYMHAWLQPGAAADELLLPAGIADGVPCLKQLQLAVLKGVGTFENIFGRSKQNGSFELELNGKLCTLNAALQNERLIMIYVQQILFIIAQLVEQQTLQRAQAERAASYLQQLLAIVRKLEADTDAAAAVVNEDSSSSGFMHKILHYIFNIRLTYIRSAELFNASHESLLNYLYFLRELTTHCSTIMDFDTHAVNYRLKLVKAVAISMQNLDETKAQSEQLTECIKLLNVFRLNAENCIEILNLLATQLKYSDFFTTPAMQQKSIYFDLLVCVLQRLAALGKSVECELFMKKFVKFYTNFIRKASADLNLEQLEEAFYNFLCITHQYIPRLDVKFFESMFVERKLSKASIKLACLLLERDAKLHEYFIQQQLPANIEKKELIYPLLNIMFHQKIHIESTLLNNIYQAFKNGFMRTIEKPQKAGVIYKENALSSIALIERCMPKSECLDFCNKNFKFDAVETYQIQLIHAIYRKAFDSLGEQLEATFKQKSNIFINFINLQIQLLSVDLKKQLVNAEKLELCAYLLFEWCESAGRNMLLNSGEAAVAAAAVPPPASRLNGLLDFSKILNSAQWLNFCKLCLKLGMQVHEADAEQQQQADALNGLLLKLLAYLCELLYADYMSAAAADEGQNVECAEAAQLFEMICTHSKFYDILLGQQQQRAAGSSHAQVKTQLLHLLYTLAKKAPSALSTTQIPIILGAYQAKLSEADRYALALLQLYELYDCGLQQYRPFIWGESAIAFYSLRAADEERAKLTQQETSIAQVMSLVDKQLCEYTLENFPIWRKLNAAQQLPTVEFANPSLKAQTFGSNSLERRIEHDFVGGAGGEFSEADLRFCPKRDGIYEQCYDPAFFVPLMNMCFAPEAYAHPARPVQNGLLAMVFAALSSQDKDMRLAAGSVQLRYRSHFENSKFFERPLWIQTYENIQSGLSELRDAWMKHKKNSGTPRVPYISGLFVAKTLNLTTDPTHLLYKQLTMYLRLKNSFNFQCVPEFNVLFYSPEVEHQHFRQFIVEIIRNGIKCSSDLFLLVTTNIFKVLMGFYGSSISTLDMNLLILSLFSTCVRIPASTKIMIEHVGILPWLNSIISSIEFYQFDIIEGLISIVNNLWYALQANAKEFHNFPYIMLELHQLVLLLLPHLSARISIAGFAKLMNILNKTAAVVAGQHLAMSSTQLSHIVDCTQRHFPTHVGSIESVMHLGGAGAESHVAYCKRLYEQQLDTVSILALSSVRAYVIAWKGEEQQAILGSSNESLLNASLD